MNFIPDIKLIPFSKEFIPELSILLADAYMKNNPFIAPLKLTRDQMIEEFANTLKGKLFHIIMVFVEKAIFEEANKIEIVGCWCWGELMDFFPKNELAFENNIDYNMVPTKDKVRIYMRYMSLKPVFDKYKIQKGEYLYGSNFCVKPKYQGKGFTYQIYYFAYKFLLENGYKRFFGNVINTIVQDMAKKSALADEIVIDVSDMYVLETKEFPFKGLNLRQITYLIDIKETFDILEAILAPKSKL